ncbi:BTB domain-containing protein [Caerostris extrusa]|uniref:BTB domain-containing protein n=1 Tax=Caerostris extrusa TaxID=172846 RepID=A0AAV4R2B8_CAEEX|nr:BTB domain-containing protein [Caerostris extrusa]
MENLLHNKNIDWNAVANKHAVVTGKICLPKKSSTLTSITGKSHHARLGVYAANLWREKAMTDVLIVVQNQEFKAHKAVLACYSPYFSSVFVKPGFSDVHYLQLPTVTAKAFGILLEYMYTGKLKVSCQELSDVYRSAKKLGIKEEIVFYVVEIERTGASNNGGMLLVMNFTFAYVRKFSDEILRDDEPRMNEMIANFG